jgi:sarcosine oxidase subunit alpha
VNHRLPPADGEVLDRTKALTFTWNGKKLEGFEGDTITSALMANGHHIIGRSMKYHRPRGVLTADFWDPNTTVQVGDEPNVRASHRKLEAGMQVVAQNVWPSLSFDIKAANGLVGRFLTAGFYYKTFMKPAALWPRYEHVLAKFAPGGEVDLDTPHGRYDKRFAHPDVVVAGGGPAGLSAAIAAAEAGSSVMLVEHEHHVGGHLLWGTEEDRARVADLTAAALAAGVEILTNSTVTGRYEDNWIAILQRNHPGVVERLIKARAKTLVVAAGTIERPYVFEGNDLPGVMTSGAVRRLITMYGVKPGKQAVVFSANESGEAAIDDLRRAGVSIARVVDALTGERIVSTKGSKKRVKEVLLEDGAKIKCDLVVTAVGWTTPTSLLNMAGDRPVYDADAARFFPSGAPDNVLATGGMVGDGSLDDLIEHGRVTGELAAGRAAVVRHRLQVATARAETVDEAEPGYLADERTPLDRWPHPELFRASTHGIVDYSEDVSSKDLYSAAAEGFDSVELIKRFTTATMGPSQGKLETVNTVAVLAQARGDSIGDVGTTVWRPPYAPISLGALAGRINEPTRLSVIQPWHEANGATPILAGQWVRPDHYGDPLSEVRNTRENVGIIDVTPLGKLDLQGPDVANLLSLLYTNKWMQLPIGSVRYGIMCAEDGVVLDDGVTARLDEEHYLMTTTSSGAARIWSWIEMWLQTERPEWQVHVTPVTTGLTSINIAGPKSRALLGRLTDIDLDNEAFPYMRVRQGRIAGIEQCIAWRIGFTGELSYEIHVPSGHGLAVWERLLAEGADLGVKPFGLEAQRIMRLEKGHFIVGQDTDGLSKAPVTGLDPLLKFDKDDWAGLPEVRWSLESGDHPVIVACQPDDRSIVPEEAAQILRSGTTEIVGRITSSRMSPTLERSICLAQVSKEFADAGTSLEVLLVDGRRITATVIEHHAHFDPEGERLRG